MDIEDLQATSYDTLRMAGKVKILSENAVLWTQMEFDMINEYGKDGWRQIPGTIMFSNGISWVCIISLNLVRNRKDEYILEKMTVHCAAWDSGFTQTGLGVQRDVRGVQEFYSLIFGSEVNQERSFVDSTSLAIVAGYKFHSKNMTAM